MRNIKNVILVNSAYAGGSSLLLIHYSLIVTITSEVNTIKFTAKKRQKIFIPTQIQYITLKDGTQTAVTSTQNFKESFVIAKNLLETKLQ